MAETYNREPLSKVFDETISEWRNDPEFNRVFLSTQERYFNHKLQAQGHVFLNEVYDALGFDRTPEAQIVGWLKNSDGDNYIDFGLYDAENSAAMTGETPNFRLKFNVDGVIWEKI